MRVDPITTGTSATAGKEQLGLSQAQPTCKSTTTGTNLLTRAERKGAVLPPSQG